MKKSEEDRMLRFYCRVSDYEHEGDTQTELGYIKEICPIKKVITIDGVDDEGEPYGEISFSASARYSRELIKYGCFVIGGDNE